MKIHSVSRFGTSRTRLLTAGALFTMAFGLTILTFAGPLPGAKNASQAPAHQQALQQLQGVSQAGVTAAVSRKTGVYNFVKAPAGEVLAPADAKASASSRALQFLAQNGALVGLNETERTALSRGATSVDGSNLQELKSHSDDLGQTHVKLEQHYKGLEVFGAQLVVHMNDSGVTGVSGDFVPNVSLSTVPAMNAAAAGENAVRLLRKNKGGNDLQVKSTKLAVYPLGLLEGTDVTSRLAYAVEVSGSALHEQVWMDAQTGAILNRIPLRHQALNRIIYTPQYGPPFDVRHEGDPYTPGPTPGTTGADPINNLYLFAGNTYNLFRSGFGRDSWNGTGGTMHSVLLANQQCPNAYWNGTATNYCPDFDADDVVAHEWGHGYTQATHNLIYSYQSGALNESYSDIAGETADLFNGVDAEGGANNVNPMPTGQRWQIGEDVNVFNQPVLGILRDMWTPTRFGQPDSTSSGDYYCGTGDGGGVHYNSGVPNHAYAMLVDGKTFGGQTVTAIGFNRALAIYYRAMTVYQTPTTDFAAHGQALRASCTDLIGTFPNALSTSSGTSVPSADQITATTCQQVDKAMLAVKMDAPIPCPTVIILDPNAPAACSTATDIYAQNWEAGDAGWTRTSTGVTVDWNDSTNNLRNFLLDNSLPAGRAGQAVRAPNIPIGEPGGGSCAPGGDYSGQFTIDSPSIAIPGGATDLKMRFDHYVATEAGFDGGQVEISVNGGAFALIPDARYVYNPPNGSLDSVIDGNTNPNAGERAWHGTNINTPSNQPPGSWGTTIIDLSPLAAPGDSIKIRFTASQDGCNGVDGWYVDNVRVYACSTITVQCPPPPFNDDLEPAPMGGWTFDVAQNNLPSPTWALTTDPNTNSPTNAFASDGTVPDIKDDRLIAPPQNLTVTSRLIFWHKFNFEDSYDGGVLEVSINGGATWVDIDSPPGNQFIAGGYNSTIDTGFDSPIAGRQAWSFINDDAPTMSRVEVNMGPFAGNGVLVRWRLALDNGVLVPGGGPWAIDDIQFTNLACDIPVPVPTAVVSRKVHGAAGAFDIPLPLTGTSGIECRTGGVTQIVLTFPQAVTFAGAAMNSGTGTVTTTTGSGTNQAVINLSGVTNQQNIAVSLQGVSAGGASGNILIPIGVLLGDTSDNRSTNASDVGQTKSFSGQPATASNFRTDVTVNGSINASDVGAVKAESGKSIP